MHFYVHLQPFNNLKNFFKIFIFKCLVCKSQFITYVSCFDDVIFSRPLLLAAVCKHGERLALSSNAVTSGLVFFNHIARQHLVWFTFGIQKCVSGALSSTGFPLIKGMPSRFLSLLPSINRGCCHKQLQANVTS